MFKPEEIVDNWNKFISNIEKYISSPRKEKLLKLYELLETQIVLYPASTKLDYHNAVAGGYIDHINRVVDCSLKLYSLWKEQGMDTSSFTLEELIFSAINHDLGKVGDVNTPAYLPQTDQWRKEKLGEEWIFNNKLSFASVPDRSIYLLQAHDIKFTLNEMIALQTHDGLFDEANKKYLISFNSYTKPRSSLPYILHQADMMASRIEWEKVWLPVLNDKSTSEPKKTEKTQKQKNFELKAKATPTSRGLIDELNNL